MLALKCLYLAQIAPFHPTTLILTGVMTMPTFLFPLLLLGFALSSILLAQATGHDVYHVLAMGNFIVCLVWTCAIAHWSLQLLALLVLLWVSGRWTVGIRWH